MTQDTNSELGGDSPLDTPHPASDPGLSSCPGLPDAGAGTPPDNPPVPASLYLPPPWNEREVSILKEMWADGKTAFQIAEVLGRTRSSVLGKKWRLKLLNPIKINNRKTMVSVVRSRKKKHLPAKVNAFGKSIAPELILPPPPITCPGSGIGILDLGSHNCRVVIGIGNDNLARYCGQRVHIVEYAGRIKLSWCCPQHHKENYYRVPGR